MHFNWDINLTRWLDSRDAFEHPSILIFVESIGNTSFCSSNTIGVGWIAARSNRKKERKKFLCDIPIDIINVISLRSKKIITLLSSSLLFIFSSLFSYPLFFFFPLFAPSSTSDRSGSVDDIHRSILAHGRVHARSSRIMAPNANTFCDFINDGDTVYHVGPLHRTHTTLLCERYVTGVI